MSAIKVQWVFISSCVYICLAGFVCVFARVYVCVLHVHVTSLYVMGICICAASVKL